MIADKTVQIISWEKIKAVKGVTSVKLYPEMLSVEGFYKKMKLSINESGYSWYTVRFDKTYVLDFLEKRFLEALKIDREVALELIRGV